MEKSQLIASVVIATIIASLFMVFATDNLASATITTPSIDSTAGSHDISYTNKQNPTLTVTTSTSQEIIYAAFYVKNSGESLGISSSPALTWHYRGGIDTSAGNGEIAAWWAVSATAQAVTISFTSSGPTGGGVVAGFSVKDADTTSPFDPNVSSAASNSGSSGTASASVTTTNPNSLIIGMVGINNNKAITVGAGYTAIDNTGKTSRGGADEYKQVPTTGTYSPAFTFASTHWVEVADAFVPAKQTITVTSNPATGSGYIMVNGSAQSTPYSGTWAPGTTLALSAIGTVAGSTGTQYVFSSWSDGGSQTHYYTVQSASETITANYQTQYQLTFNVDPSSSGSIEKSSGYYASGSTTVEATPNSGFVFDHWSSMGSVSLGNSADASTSLVVSGPGSVTANFVPATYSSSISITINPETADKEKDTVTITGVLTSGSTALSGKTVTLSFYNVTEWVTIGSTTTLADGGYQYDWIVPADVPNGQYTIKGDFAGDAPFLACSSVSLYPDVVLTVLPEYSLGGLFAVLVCLATMLVFYSHKKRSLKQ